MRTLEKNKQKMYYALYKGVEPEYVLDENGNKIIDYTDEDGNVYYRETGNKVPTYFEPVLFYANISMSGGEISTQEYGIDVSSYDAIVVLDKGQIPIEETSLIWYESLPTYKDADRTIVDGNKADYRVLAIKPSLNQLKVVLGRITK
jgi:hypothetical protein